MTKIWVEYGGLEDQIDIPNEILKTLNESSTRAEENKRKCDGFTYIRLTLSNQIGH